MPIFILLFNTVQHVHGSIQYLVLRKLWNKNKNMCFSNGAGGAMTPPPEFCG